MWAFHSFLKGCTLDFLIAAQCPLNSMRIVEYVYTWGRWTEHPDRCVLHTICSTWLGKHLMAYYGVMWLATSQSLWAVEPVIQNLQKCTWEIKYATARYFKGGGGKRVFSYYIFIYIIIYFTYFCVIICIWRWGKMEKRMKGEHGEGMSLSSLFFGTNVITRLLRLSNLHSPIKQATTKSF